MRDMSLDNSKLEGEYEKKGKLLDFQSDEVLK